MLAGENGHSVNMLDHKLAVRYPQTHIRQIMRVKPRFLHRLIQRGKQLVVGLIDLHSGVRQFGGIRIILQ